MREGWGGRGQRKRGLMPLVSVSQMARVCIIHFRQLASCPQISRHLITRGKEADGRLESISDISLDFNIMQTAHLKGQMCRKKPGIHKFLQRPFERGTTGGP